MRRTKKRHSFHGLFEGNKVVLMCVLFTVNTVITAISSSLRGEIVNLTIEFVSWNLLYLTAPILPLVIFQRLWESRRIQEKDYLLWTGISLHFVISCGLILLYTFILSFFEPLTQNIYVITVLNYIVGYAIIFCGAVIIDLLKTASLNRCLQKIQENQRSLNP